MASSVDSSVERAGSNVTGFFPMPVATSSHTAQVFEQPFQLAQSFSLVQITVCAVVSTIAAVRHIFSDDCFRRHRYDIEDPKFSYKDFMNTAEDDTTPTLCNLRRVGRESVPFDILARGRDVGADKLLDWMELGMADALSHKFLATMQLSIYNGEISLAKRMEAYIMEFSYSDASTEMRLQLSDEGGLSPPLSSTISSTKKDIRLLFHDLKLHIGGLPKLFPHTIINMHFTYNETCPKSYEPPGFMACQDQNLVLQNNDGAAVGSIRPGPHSLNLRVFLSQRVPKSLNASLPKSPTKVAKLRPRAPPRPLDNELSPETDTKTREETQAKNASRLAGPHSTQEPDHHLSQLSNVTSASNTQEREQIAAIETMARLRLAQHDFHDTQMLEAGGAAIGNRQGSVNLDGDSTTCDGSSTQGTPSTINGRRSKRLAEKPAAAKSQPQPPRALRPRKRQSEPSLEHSPAKLRKVSVAKSPFQRKRSK